MINVESYGIKILKLELRKLDIVKFGYINI